MKNEYFKVIKLDERSASYKQTHGVYRTWQSTIRPNEELHTAICFCNSEDDANQICAALNAHSTKNIVLRPSEEQTDPEESDRIVKDELALFIMAHLKEKNALINDETWDEVTNTIDEFYENIYYPPKHKKVEQV